jgi:hypothetical protein
VYAVDGANPYRVAVHPFNGAHAVVAARVGLPVTFTRDYGATWANATNASATSGSSTIASVGQPGNFWFAYPLATEHQIDPASPNATFYYYDGQTTLMTSTDSGATWSTTYTGFPPWHVPFFGLATPPRGAAAAGDIWAFAGWKLYHSVDGGKSFASAWQL